MNFRVFCFLFFLVLGLVSCGQHSGMGSPLQNSSSGMGPPLQDSNGALQPGQESTDHNGQGLPDEVNLDTIVYPPGSSFLYADYESRFQNYWNALGTDGQEKIEKIRLANCVDYEVLGALVSDVAPGIEFECVGSPTHP